MSDEVINKENEDKIKISLRNLGTINKNVVTISKGYRKVNLYFSYKTIVGVNDFISVNNWSRTTGRFLNELQPIKEERLPHEEVLLKVEELLKDLLK